MKQLVFGVILATIGTLLIIFREGFVKDVVRLNNKDGLGFYKYGKNEIKIQLLMVIGFGTLFIILGVLAAVGIFKVK